MGRSGQEAAEAEHFDAFARDYQDILDTNLRWTGESGDSFVRYRMEYLRRRLPLLPRRVLDFGCGIGLALPHLVEAFPGCEVVGVDVSERSVMQARRRCSGPVMRVCLPSELVERDFDLAYASGVFHHIPLPQRRAQAAFILDVLRPGGVLVLAEHNPWNPATRYLVNTCPFDEGVRLLRPRTAASLLESAGFSLVLRDYVSFCPGRLRFLRPVEPWLRWLPVGAQYIIVARRGA